MKAVVKVQPVVGAELRDVPMPTIGPDDLLVKVRAIAICGTDNHIYDWTPYAQARLPLPMIFGHEYTGEVVEVGSNVRGWEVGDLVSAEPHVPCLQCFQCRTGRQHTCEHTKYIGVHLDGAFSEYAALPAVCAWKLPAGTSPDLGALLEPAGVAVNGLLKDRVDGRSLVVIGCGPIGLFCAQLALACGARTVFATDVSDYRLALARRVLPGVTVLDARTYDVKAEVLEATAGRGAEVVVELSGSQAGITQAFELLALNGRVSLIGLPSVPITLDLIPAIIYKEAVVYGSTGRLMWDTWYRLDDLIQAGRFDPTTIVTHRFALADFDQAFALTRSGNAGKVLLFP